MKLRVKRKISFLPLVVIGALALFIMFPKTLGQNPPSKELLSLEIGQSNIQVEVVDQPTDLEKGLYGRKNLDKNEGMYFILGQRKVATFHMKGMKFPIDIIWIDNGKVIGFVKDAPLPNKNSIPTFTSPSEVTHVLEVSAGFSDENNLKVGNEVNLIN